MSPEAFHPGTSREKARARPRRRTVGIARAAEDLAPKDLTDAGDRQDDAGRVSVGVEVVDSTMEQALRVGSITTITSSTSTGSQAHPVSSSATSVRHRCPVRRPACDVDAQSELHTNDRRGLLMKGEEVPKASLGSQRQGAAAEP